MEQGERQLAGGSCQIRTETDKRKLMKITNNKWFDKLTTLSQVEGQITMTETPYSKSVLVIETGAPPCGRGPSLVLGIWDFKLFEDLNGFKDFLFIPYFSLP